MTLTLINSSDEGLRFVPRIGLDTQQGDTILQKLEVHLVHSFTNNGTGGNAAGVVFNASGLNDAQKLQIAKAVGYSETAFISNDAEADFEVTFFTTTDEVDFCGHATIATFSMLFNKGLLAAGSYTQRTKAGVLAVHIEPDAKIVMEQQLPTKLERFSHQEIAPLIGIKDNVLASTNMPIEAISTGLADLIIPVPQGQLEQLQPDHRNIARFCDEHHLVGFHVFELCEPDNPISASCRNFAPLFGIPEESATGTSNGALACYLAEHLGRGKDFVFEQGRAMGQSSIITASVTMEASRIIKVSVGGYAHGIGTKLVSLCEN